MLAILKKVKVTRMGAVSICWEQEAADGKRAKWTAEGAIHTPRYFADALNFVATIAARANNYPPEIAEQCAFACCTMDYKKGLAAAVQFAVPAKRGQTGAGRSAKLREKALKDSKGTVLEEASDESTVLAIHALVTAAGQYIEECKKAGAA